MLVFLAACVTGPTGRRQLILISEEKEISLGLEAYQEVLKEEQVVKSGPQAARIRAIGEKVAGATGKDYDWEFNVIQKPDMINAFCLPGGKVAVYTGLINLAESDDELAVVIGHEIAHATIRHGAERISQNMVVNLGLEAANLFINTENEQVKQGLMAALGVGAQVGVLLPYSRRHENEADSMGLEYMWKAGYDPEAGVTFWKKMQAQSGDAPPEFLSTHPATESRIENLRQLALELKSRGR